MQVIVEIPYIFVQTTYYSLIVYAMVSFQWTVAKFFWFFFITFFSFLYFTYYGMMTVSITPNHQTAAIFASAFYALFTLFSGFFIPKPVISFPLLCITFKISTSPHIQLQFELSENPQVVDMVLLYLPGGMDSLWTNCDTVW